MNIKGNIGSNKVKTTPVLCFSSATMADKPGMAEMEKFEKSKQKRTETQEKNPPPSKEAIEQEKQAGKSSRVTRRQYAPYIHKHCLPTLFFSCLTW